MFLKQVEEGLGNRANYIKGERGIIPDDVPGSIAGFFCGCYIIRGGGGGGMGDIVYALGEAAPGEGFIVSGCEVVEDSSVGREI